MSFDALVASAEAAAVDGWDFGWLDGRATEQRPSWGYASLLASRLPTVDSALDLQTGGGEVLDSCAVLPPVCAATEGWAPNVTKAHALLAPRGVEVVAHDGESPLPFADASFNLVSSRHPVAPQWDEIARVLARDGNYLAQHVGPASAFELVEFFLGPQPADVRRRRHPDDERADALAAGLEIEQRLETLELRFFDVGAVVWFLRRVIWMVPGFAVEAYRDRLRDLHELIEREGAFVAHSTRVLVEGRRAV